MEKICRDFMNNQGNCERTTCKFLHDTNACYHFWKNKCKYGNDCNKNHYNRNKRDNKRIKNTETFKPSSKTDARIIFEHVNGNKTLKNKLTDKDIIVVTNLFSDYLPGEIYNTLIYQLQNCGIDHETILKLWHGDTHLIADDNIDWKTKTPIFNMIVERIAKYFEMDVQTTRFNLYKNTEQWKPYHKDAAAIKPEIEKIQNITVAVSFGEERIAAFERDTPDKTVITFPLGDSTIYAFCNETNKLWRHGILQELPPRENSRISIILWGMKKL